MKRGAINNNFRADFNKNSDFDPNPKKHDFDQISFWVSGPFPGQSC